MRAASQPIRLLLVDDHPFIRQGLRSYLVAQPGISIVGETGNAEEALALARRHTPDVVLMDVNLPGMSGIEATRALRKVAAGARVLMLTVQTRMEYVIQMIRAGAQGYVSKDAPPAELLRAIKKVARGGLHFPAEATVAYVRDHLLAAPGCLLAEPTECLSPREREVVALVADGLTNKQMALRLGVSARTIETHRERLKKKLGLRTVAELTRFALENGLAPPAGRGGRRTP